MPDQSRSLFRSLVGTSGSAVVMSTLPFFLVGSLAHELRAEFGLSLIEVGLFGSAFFGPMALASVPMGRLVDRIPARGALIVAVSASTIAIAGTPTLVRTFWMLAALLALAGFANATAEAATNRLLSEGIAPHQLGRAVSYKQAAPAFASMLTGLALPSLVVRFGWRASYYAAALGGLIVLGRLARTRGVPLGHGRRPASGALRRPGAIILLIGTLAGGFGSSAAVLAFFVESSVSGGWPAGRAGLVLALSSSAAIAVRLFSGVVVDRTRLDGLGLTALLIGAGSLGFLLLPLDRPWLVTVGAVLALGGTWGFPGVMFSAVLQHFPGSAGRATGVVSLGVVGGLVVPAAFGWTAQQFGYTPAWLATAALAFVTATCAFGARQVLRRHDPASHAPA